MSFRMNGYKVRQRHYKPTKFGSPRKPVGLAILFLIALILIGTSAFQEFVVNAKPTQHREQQSRLATESEAKQVKGAGIAPNPDLGL